MTEFLIGVFVFACGGFTGFIVAAFFAVGARDDDEEFDGGFLQSNHPPVKTRIWHGSIEDDRA